MSDKNLVVRQIGTLPSSIVQIEHEALAQGHHFVSRLIENWHPELNQFSLPGEIFLGAFESDSLVAIGGLNRDPYESLAKLGRIRHFYVRASFRRMSIGSMLLGQLLEYARQTFDNVRLRTLTVEGAAFYERNGFVPIIDVNATHFWYGSYS
ncbi:GNAT family N-acetyltransferase [Sphingomonas sp. SUN039]|uniref:GNAT family N-acetyltransferase n=1 Tax=Sphingomonas sp. SUN039 TaxID=2937787 RepID=UPI002164D52A|nr:GNAT family N-acetyltransferase [Sphingomonas sp. SUN039]UVO52918.1 GNAT family N-acetyltransferase [Sphingomonas sp. SUN039]